MKNITIKFIQLGSVFMALSVALGAFGAHMLKPIYSAYEMAIYTTAVEYQFYHALGLLAIAFISHVSESKKVNLAGNIMAISIVIFSGSLYILAATGIKWLGAITPIGGTGFIIAWIILAVSIRKSH